MNPSNWELVGCRNEHGPCPVLHLHQWLYRHSFLLLRFPVFPLIKSLLHEANPSALWPLTVWPGRNVNGAMSLTFSMQFPHPFFCKHLDQLVIFHSSPNSFAICFQTSLWKLCPVLFGMVAGSFSNGPFTVRYPELFQKLGYQVDPKKDKWRLDHEMGWWGAAFFGEVDVALVPGRRFFFLKKVLSGEKTRLVEKQTKNGENLYLWWLTIYEHLNLWYYMQTLTSYHQMFHFFDPKIISFFFDGQCLHVEWQFVIGAVCYHFKSQRGIEGHPWKSTWRLDSLALQLAGHCGINRFLFSCPLLVTAAVSAFQLALEWARSSGSLFLHYCALEWSLV